VHAHEVRAHEMPAHKVQAHETYAREMHAHETHAYKAYPHEIYCGGANWSLAPYGHENCPLEHLLEIARTHTDSIKQAFYPKRVSRLCPPIIAMPSLSYSLPLDIPLSLQQYTCEMYAHEIHDREVHAY
jgi:hypothetical protein